MTALNKKALRANLVASLRFIVDDGHVLDVVDSILNDVADDIDDSVGQDYGSEDVKRSVGRVLSKRLGIESVCD